MTDEITLSARWVFPVATPPLERGTVTICGERIVAVEEAGVRRPDVDCGETAIIPGLVNAHTHLDLSGLRGQVPYTGDFTAWLRAVVGHRRLRSAEQVREDVRLGLAESTAAGVTLVADISAGGFSRPTLLDAAVRSVVFYELLGLTKERAGLAWTAGLEWLRRQATSGHCRAALSPHAPYSVRASLFRAAAALSGRVGFPLAVHLSETRDEMELLATHEGRFVEFLRQIGVWDPDGLVADAADVMNLSTAAQRIVFAHGNYLSAHAKLARNASVVYCPRTHAFFGHGPHPFREMLAKGVNVALGTDSLASNPDLDLFAEAVFVHRLYPEMDGSALLRMATLAGAEALGWADETGSLEAGKSADLVVMPLGAEGEPHQRLLAGGDGARRVMCRGRWL